MSRLIIARTSATFSPAGGARVKCVDPSVPSSSPEKSDEHDFARARLGLGRKLARDLEHRRRPRRVVVGAHVRQVAVGRQRVTLAEAEVIVVRADHDHARTTLAQAAPATGSRADHVERLLGRVAERDLQLGADALLLLQLRRRSAASAARLTISTGMPASP